MEAVPEGSSPGRIDSISFAGAGYPGLPLYRRDVQGGGERLEFDYRLLRILEPSRTGPANLVAARLWLAEGIREVTGYWHLVYAAEFHNEFQRFRVILDPPLGDVHAVEFYERFGQDNPARVDIRGAGMELLRHMPIETDKETLLEDPEAHPFRRGDVTADGRVNVSDAVALLLYQFGRRPEPPCADAADIDDSGSIGLADAVALLGYLFTGGAAPVFPFESCGLDPTSDASLTCERFPPCQGAAHGG
jgi:hypothetical protein